MGLLERIDRQLAPRNSTWGGGLTFPEFDEMMSEYFSFAGSQYPLGGVNLLYNGVKSGEDIGVGMPEYVRAVMQSPPAFGAQLVRSLVLSQARFTFRRRLGDRGLFSNDSLRILERPWPKGTTGELISKMEWHEGLAGNSFVYRSLDDRGTSRDRLRVLRPDWMVIVFGSELDPDEPDWQLDAEVIGYAYLPGGPGKATRIEPLLPEEVAHWSPLPDPLAIERGMSWLTPVIREIQGDSEASSHKIQYFRHGATPNLVIKGVPGTTPAQFNEWVDQFDQKHSGWRNAWRTIYLAIGTDATVVGNNLKDIDYRALQGASETRISVASRVPAPVLGISEGLAGSSLNAGNYGQSRRNLADIWVYPSLQSLAAALGQVVDVPDDAEQWFDTVDMPVLREDARDAAEIFAIQANAARALTDGGWEPESVKAAVKAQDISLATHTGKLSVQLQPVDGSTDGDDGTEGSDSKPAEDEPDESTKAAAEVLALSQALQRIYLAVVNNVITAEEARRIVNRMGADLPEQLPAPEPDEPEEPDEAAALASTNGRNGQP